MGPVHHDCLVLSATLPPPNVAGIYKEYSGYQGLPEDLQTRIDGWKYHHIPEQKLHWGKPIRCRCVRGYDRPNVMFKLVMTQAICV